MGRAVKWAKKLVLRERWLYLAPMKFTFDSVIFHTSDLAGIRAFYEEKLGFSTGTYKKDGQELPDYSETYVNYPIAGGLVCFEQGDTSSQGDMVIRVEQFADYRRRLTDGGVPFAMEKEFFFMVKDPEGRTLIFEPSRSLVAHSGRSHQTGLPKTSVSKNFSLHPALLIRRLTLPSVGDFFIRLNPTFLSTERFLANFLSRVLQSSSLKATSKTQWHLFSMPQCFLVSTNASFALSFRLER